jgi:hypothetical protein
MAPEAHTLASRYGLWFAAVISGTLFPTMDVGARNTVVCNVASESVVAYAAGSDRYAARVESGSGEPRYLVVRRMSTGEPLDDVACVQGGRCELTDALGMRACSFTSVHSSRITHGLVLEASPEGAASVTEGSSAAGKGRWVLAQEAKGGHVSLLRLRGAADLEVRSVRIVGQRVLVVIRETRGAPPCEATRERIVVLDEAELRPGRARLEQAHADVDVDAELSTEPLPPPRFAPPFRPVPTRTVVNAARSAIATGMERLAACWIQHNAAAMSRRARLALHRQLSVDRDLAPLARLASDPIGAPVRRRHHAVTTDVR